MPKQPQDHNEKSYGGWSKDKLVDLDLPSGALAQVKRPGLQGLIKAGVLDDLDTLTAIVATETIPKAEGKPPIDATKGLDAKKLEEAIAAMDKVLLYVVVQPTLMAAPDNDEDRRDDVYYLDEVDIEDKGFILQYVMGGSSSLEQFRAATAEALGSVPAGT